MFLITLKGVITGLILSLPFGPVGIYCMEKTMIEGHKRGYVSALGMVTVDIIYALTALLFMSYVEDLIMRYESLLQILVAIFLIFVGWKKLEKRVKIKKIECTPTGIVKDYFITFFIALANLSGIFTILVIFTTLKVYSEETFLVAPFIALGIFLGGSIEWFTTTYVIANFTKVLDERKLIKISQLSGGIIFLFGVLILAKNTLKIL
ncbi:LysE family translocator [Fusobacterium necrogenes]|uniref:LysE family translocator n=1 Tax=Fusobacterium necrogenes TaxID=858 RepID=UPI00255CFA29|nr:LysE family transporter [Fusobacterium necrogenes]